VARNVEAGHADGVVALAVPGDAAAGVAARLLLHLREALPAAELQANWGQAATYLEYRRDRPEDGHVLRSMPAVADFPLIETCRSCRVDPCGRPARLCSDCGARDAVAGRRTRIGPAGDAAADTGLDALGTERLVIDAVRQAVGRPLRPVRDMGELAGLGDAGGNRNHDATVAFDGNGMGGFFAALASQDDIALKQQISPEISAATRAALVAAAREITRNTDRLLPVIPHVLGGDDVVVSVTADRAWPFTRVFLASFTEALTAVATRLALPGLVSGRLPSMSAGVVFAHASFPYARAVQLADETLRHAKRDTQGGEAAASWLDVTVDGEARPVWRSTLTMNTLAAQAPDLAALGAIQRSGRQTIARLLAGGIEEESRAAGLSWARRNNYPIVTSLLNEASLSEVRNLVALTRWWRP
jgi:hypothetical protein